MARSSKAGDVMKIAAFWTRAEAQATSPRGKRFRVTARGWSNDSLAAARARALEIAERLAQVIAAGFTSRQRYPYGERPLPEPVVREFNDNSGEKSAIVTRNAYGALVLNANQLMFVDVDRKDGQPNQASLGKMLSTLFGKPKAIPKQSPQVLDALNDITARHGLAARIYQTKAGYRVMITSGPFTAGSPEAESILTEFGCDPLYIRLCRLQECFRARLTPKPFRCGMTNPPVLFPFETPDAADRFARWETNYNAKTSSFATCRFLSAIGTGLVVSDFSELIQYHDDATKASSQLALA